jgi:hypothetical protein
VETLLDSGTDDDVAEAEAAIERLAAAPARRGRRGHRLPPVTAPLPPSPPIDDPPNAGAVVFAGEAADSTLLLSCIP